MKQATLALLTWSSKSEVTCFQTSVTRARPSFGEATAGLQQGAQLRPGQESRPPVHRSCTGESVSAPAAPVDTG